jgi:hypothetical protein
MRLETILPGTGRWQPGGLTEGAYLGVSVRSVGPLHPPELRSGGPPPRSGEE